MENIKVLLIGAGLRGRAYTDIMKDNGFEVVAVADPDKGRRDYIRDTHNIPEEMCFENWDRAFEQPKLADVAIIATQDHYHHEPAMKAIALGYNILLEKPVAPTPQECADIASAAKAKGVKVLVCHVLRYTPFFSKIKEYIMNDKLGDVISIHHLEPVGNRHQSHSFVRGNWGNEARSNNMLLAKSCHDMDIIQWLMDSKCTRVQSFGSLSYFTKENAPEGAPDYCIEGCPHGEECYYNAVKLYLEDKANNWFRRAATNKVDPADEDVEEALRTTQYGKCVFKCDNDVVDHQVVNMEFENGATAAFTMSAFNKGGGRELHVMGTKGELFGDADTDIIRYYDFATRETTEMHPYNDAVNNSLDGGHGGGDKGIVNTLRKYLTEGYDGAWLSEIAISVDNHMIAFAAEESRHMGTVVNMEDFKNKFFEKA